MRRGFWLALVLSVGAALWALLWPIPEVSLGGVVAARGTGNAAARFVGQPAIRILPARWEAPMPEPARRNPFGADAPPPVAKAASAPAPKLVVAQPTPGFAAPPPPSVPQAFGYRYLGRMIDPQGQRVVYVARGDVVVTVQPGTQLNDGYAVESVSESSIEFVNPTTQQRHTMPIPPDASATAAANRTTQ